MQTAIPVYVHRHFEVFYARFKSSPSINWRITGKYPISLFFCLMGPGARLSAKEQVVIPSFVSSKKMNVLYRGRTPAKLSWSSAAEIEFIEIRISEDYLNSFIGSEPGKWEAQFNLRRYLKGMLTGEEAWALSPSIGQVINQIIHVLRKPVLYQDMMIEAKVMETVALLFEQLQQTAIPKPVPEAHTRIATQAQKQIHAIKGKKQFTIIDLAQQLGTNETTLKQAFKATFGKTIFRYFQERNMEGAKEALQAGKAIAEVATRFGYTTMSHFCHAFKKEFGVSPSRYQVGLSK